MSSRSLLEGLGLPQYAPAFDRNDIDDETLPTLTDADLVTIGVASLGHRKKILRAIAEGRHLPPTEERGPAPPGLPSGPAGSTTLAAKRELTRTMPGPLVAALEARGYVILDRIGQGGMGEVYLAQQTSVGRDVAVKVLSPGSDAADRARFAREARAIAALNHPHVVRFFDYVIVEDGSACIVMEHVVGQSLAALFAHEGRIPFERMVPIAMQICDALSEAHQKGIVHRDLKPANILLQEAEGYREFARVLDFGLAHWVSQAESRLTRTGAVYGTPRYLSPEQIVGSAITPRSDLYALGVILWEGLAGHPPFGGEVDAALLFRHLKEPAPPLPEAVDRPRALDGLLSRLLAKSAAVRPASAAALRRELAEMLDPGRSTKLAALATPSGPVTERRNVVVVDVSFLDKSRLPAAAELADTIARQGQARIDGVARRSGGTLTSRTAHGASLVFGAPIARKGDLERALGAALELRSALAAADPEHARVRIGVADGSAVSGGLRDGPGGGFFVSGAPVDAAESLRDACAPGEIRVARSIVLREPAGLALELAPGGEHAFLVGRADASTSQLRPFVGREKETAAVAAVLENVGAGTPGAIVVVSGEAGIGKSRFVDRVRSLAHGRAMRSARGMLFDVEVSSAEDALHQIVGELLALPDDASNRAQAIERRLGPDALRAEEWPFLYHYLGVPLPGPMQRVYDAMDPIARAGGYRDMLLSLFAQESRGQPLLLVIEDLHWADGPILEVLELCADLTVNLPIVLVLTTRVEEESRWKHVLERAQVTRVELAPLGASDLVSLAERLGVPESARDAMVERAAGHPLLLTELARQGQNDSGPLPDSIQDLVLAKIDRLTDADRQAIAVAAVLGPRFDVVALRGILGMPAYVPTALESHRLLSRSEDGTWTFTHGLVREAVYATLVDDRRRALHEKAASAARTPALVAMHLERAGSPRAGKAYLDTALGEIERHELSAAREHLLRGLGCTDDPDVRRELESARGGVELALGDSKVALAAYEAMRGLATAAPDVHRAEIGLASALRAQNRWDDAVAALDRAEIAGAGVAASIARARYLRGGIEFSRGRVAASQAAHEEALRLATEAGAIELRTQALSGLADAHYGAGRLVSAHRTWSECVAIARAEKLLAVEAVNLPMLAIVQVFLGEAEKARATAIDAIGLAQSLSRTRAEAVARGGAALAGTVRGAHAEALVHGQRGLELVRKLGHIVFEETVLYYMALAQLGLGDRSGAAESIERGLGLARKHGMHFVGATLVAMHARFVPGRDEKLALLAEGEALVEKGTLSFDRFWFHQNAIEVALDLGAHADVHRHADAIVRTEEPLPWARAIAERAHALAEAAAGRPDRARLERALAVVQTLGLASDAAALEAALAGG